jgi:hypothetical protein
MILLLIPVGGIVLGLALWVGLRGLAIPGMGIDRPERGSRASWRDRHERGDGISWRPGALLPSSASGGLREWADRMPAGCLIAVIAVTGLWVLGWLIFLVYGLNLLS